MSGLTPYDRTLGIREEGDALLLPFDDSLIGRPGFLHGGVMTALAEAAARRAAPAGARIVSLTVEFLRAGRPREARAAATVVRAGSKVAQVEATVWQDDEERPICMARMTVLVGGD